MTPFRSAEEAWFWFIDCERAKDDGARIVAGLGRYDRPCAPTDIYVVVTRLVQKGLLRPYHLLTLKNFGKQGFRPDATIFGCSKSKQRYGETGHDEREAAKWWDEAMQLIEAELSRKGVVKKDNVRKFA